MLSQCSFSVGSADRSPGNHTDHPLPDIWQVALSWGTAAPRQRRWGTPTCAGWWTRKRTVWRRTNLGRCFVEEKVQNVLWRVSEIDTVDSIRCADMIILLFAQKSKFIHSISSQCFENHSHLKYTKFAAGWNKAPYLIIKLCQRRQRPAILTGFCFLI